MNDGLRGFPEQGVISPSVPVGGLVLLNSSANLVSMGNQVFLLSGVTTTQVAQYPSAPTTLGRTSTIAGASNYLPTFLNGVYTLTLTGQSFRYSTDNLTSAVATGAASLTTPAVAVVNGNLIITAASSLATIQASNTNGLTWTAVTMPSTAAWTNAVWGAGFYAASAAGAVIAYSAALTSGWAAAATVPSPVTAWNKPAGNPFGMVYFDSGAATSAIFSTNGTTWTASTVTGAGSAVVQSAASPSVIGAIIASSTTGWYSTNGGSTWATTTLPFSTGASGYGLYFFNNLFHLFAASSYATSPDFQTWTNRTSTFPAITLANSASPVSTISGTSGIAVVPSSGTNIRVSFDYTTWTSVTVGTTPSSVAGGNGALIVALASSEVGVFLQQYVNNPTVTAPSGVISGTNYYMRVA